MTLSTFLISLAGVIWGIELIPQIYKTLVTKRAEDMSLVFFCLCLFAYVIYMIGNMLVGNWLIVIAHIPSLIGNTIMVVLVYRYGTFNGKKLSNKDSIEQKINKEAQHSYVVEMMKHLGGE